jgi:cysteine-rich repeat protein
MNAAVAGGAALVESSMVSCRTMNTLSRRLTRVLLVMGVGAAPLQCGGGDDAAGDTEAGTTDATGEASTGEVDLCGNGVVDEGEECDDGNDVNGDGCNNDCRPSHELQWSVVYDGGHGDDCAEAVAADADANVFAVGWTTAASGLSDVWIRKYDPEGNELWTRTVDGPAGGHDRGRAAAVDSQGNVLVAGFVTGDPSQGRNLWVRKLDPTGETLWTHVHGGDFGGDDVAYGLAVLADDSILVVGEETVDVGNTVAWLRRLDSEGEVLWTRTVEGSAGALDSARGVAVNAQGDIAVTGWITTTAEGRVVWVQTIDDGGTELWTRTHNGGASNGNLGNGVGLTSTGGVIVTGSTRAGSDSSTDKWTRLYGADGEERWTELFQSLDGGVDVGNGVAVGSDDQFAILGTFSNAGRRSMRLAKRTPDDVTMWTETFTGGPNTDSDGWAVAVDPHDYLLFVGCRFAEGEPGMATVAKISP